jgi:hypothetical protein
MMTGALGNVGRSEVYLAAWKKKPESPGDF